MSAVRTGRRDRAAVCSVMELSTRELDELLLKLATVLAQEQKG